MSLLPPQFAVLEPHVAFWAAPTLAGRDARRLESTPEQRMGFYNAARDLAAPALAHLDGKSFADYSAADHRLLDLLLALVHVSLAVEIEGAEEPIHARGAHQMPITRERADARTLASQKERKE